MTVVGAVLLTVSLPACDQEFSSMQMQGVEKSTVEVDLDASVERQSRAVTHKTIFNQDRVVAARQILKAP